ncbi:ornithine cyclodeaminase family protein [Nocardia sp. CDC159]|uniref:Ornithine cyclodeaminase family protein n=1 Tax=Nocardia pulmonis TaxID=2951408 RepID=A0A9X2ED92_9NOCA|nr:MULTISPECIES: ornithine cyclodeaminase family protein [Nocardia]MCM6778220.1 ornithine cyclodeaminase family protein [Nocardia pulmonis]MCM6791109.1 ornithine cyclodeaminase family protein [Nocardia sp. CDC159]
MTPMIEAARMRGEPTLRAVIDTLADAFVDLSAGRAQSPPRTLVQHSGGLSELLISPAAWGPRRLAAVKITTLTPDNPGRGLPLIHGIVVLTELATGRIVALLDGAELTALRTGAAAAIATRLCARPEAAELAIIGAGVQARALVRAISVVRPIDSVRLWSRTRARAEDFAEWIPANVGRPARITVCDSAFEAVRDAEVICTATATGDRAPLLAADWIAPGAHLNVIGGIHEHALEIDPALLKSALVTVEERRAAQEEAGEIRAALAQGLIESRDLHELGTLLRDPPATAPGRTTVYRSVGLAIEDTAAAAAIYQEHHP